MNASGRLNTCKSYGRIDFGLFESGARVRNTYVTYLVERDSPKKFGLIPRGLMFRHRDISKGAICYKMDMRKIR